jgi:type II secretory pathway pseudopilin PulG
MEGLMRCRHGRFEGSPAKAGATLLDLLVALTVIASLGVAAVSAVRRWVEASQLRAAGWTLVRDLEVARQRAIQESRRQRVTVSENAIDPATGRPRAYSVGPPGEERWRELPGRIGFVESAGSSLEFDRRGLARGTLEFGLRTGDIGPLVIRVRPTGRVEVGS